MRLQAAQSGILQAASISSHSAGGSLTCPGASISVLLSGVFRYVLASTGTSFLRETGGASTAIEPRQLAARASPSDRSRNGAREEHEPAASDAAPARHLTLPLAYSGQGKLPRAAQIDIAASPRCLASART